MASSLGAVFEWYDFYLYASLAAIIGSNFFSGLTEPGQFIFVLLAFAAGFFVRPFGAIFLRPDRRSGWTRGDVATLPYRDGWFGGFLPITAFAIAAVTGNIYAGLMYPIIVAAMTFVLGVLFLRETRGRDIID